MVKLFARLNFMQYICINIQQINKPTHDESKNTTVCNNPQDYS